MSARRDLFTIERARVIEAARTWVDAAVALERTEPKEYDRSEGAQADAVDEARKEFERQLDALITFERLDVQNLRAQLDRAEQAQGHSADEEPF